MFTHQEHYILDLVERHWASRDWPRVIDALHAARVTLNHVTPTADVLKDLRFLSGLAFAMSRGD